MSARAALVLVLSATLAAAPAGAAASRWQWPLDGHQVTRAFDPPESTYGPGHRGIDIGGTPGAPVRAVAGGTVQFAGRVAGTPVVVIDHGSEQSTYQPVTARVHPGDPVLAGQIIGLLLPGHPGCPASACLHLGRKQSATYLDPMAVLESSGHFRLVPADGPPPVPPSSGILTPPLTGPITSPYGLRKHPITGVVSLHDGIDLGAPCGTPVHAAGPGVVVRAAPSGAYGLRVEIDHGGGRVTSYSHLSSVVAHPGDRVRSGDVVGAVGSTGLSTGCHLHFSVHEHGQTVDPAPLL